MGKCQAIRQEFHASTVVHLAIIAAQDVGGSQELDAATLAPPPPDFTPLPPPSGGVCIWLQLLEDPDINRQDCQPYLLNCWQISNDGLASPHRHKPNRLKPRRHRAS